MFYGLFKILFILEFYIINTFEWEFLFNLDENDKLLCYSCKGIQCEQIINNDENKIFCNKKTQLCWAGFIDQKPYRTCANRYCTPNDISLDNDIRIETCCRSNLCNSISLLLSYPTNTFISTTLKENTTTKTTLDYFVGEIIDEQSPISEDSYKNEEEEETVSLSQSQLNTSNPNSSGINWDRLTYDTDLSNRVATISNILLYLLPLLLILLF